MAGSSASESEPPAIGVSSGATGCDLQCQPKPSRRTACVLLLLAWIAYTPAVYEAWNIMTPRAATLAVPTLDALVALGRFADADSACASPKGSSGSCPAWKQAMQFPTLSCSPNPVLALTMVVMSTTTPPCAAALRASLEPSILAALSSVERPARVDWAVVVEDSLALDPSIFQSVFDMHIAHRPLGEALLSVIAVPEVSPKSCASTTASDEEGYVQVLARLATEEVAALETPAATCPAVTASAAKQLAALIRDMLVPESPGPCIRDALHSLLAAKELLDPSFAFRDTSAKARALDRAAAGLLRAAGLAERGDSVDSRSAAHEAWQKAQGVMRAGDAGVDPHFPPEHGAAAALPVLLPIGVVLLQHTLKLAVQVSRRSA